MKNRLAIVALSLCLTGCPGPTDQQTVTVYCALDRIHSEAILDEFSRSTGIRVRAKWDTEASKTTGLVNTLIAEAAAPRCDVFWNNEVSQTVVLARRGLLAPYRSPAASGIAAGFRDPDGLWTGFAARARVFIVHRKLVPEPAWPRRLEDLLRPDFRGRIGIARPLFGTTATHAAALFATRGPERAKRFFKALRNNDVRLCAGNAQLKDRVVAGELAYGLTDTDDYHLARLAGADVACVFPDQRGDEPGALLIPNSVALMKGAPHGAAARKLIDYLLSPAVEAALARSRSAQIPLRSEVPAPPWIPAGPRWMTVDWRAVGDAFPGAQAFLQNDFLR